MPEDCGLGDHRSLIGDAVDALARLDADRLEEMALSCESLSRGLIASDFARNHSIVHEASDLQREMTVFARVLEATRANRNVLRILRELRSTAIEYGCGPGSDWTVAETHDGVN